MQQRPLNVNYEVVTVSSTCCHEQQSLHSSHLLMRLEDSSGSVTPIQEPR